MINKRCLLAIFITLFLSVFSSTLFADFLDDILDEINFMRTRPQEYVEKRLIPMLNTYKGMKFTRAGDGEVITTEEGASACRECIEVMKKQKPLCPLTMDDYLCKAASKHMRDLRKTGGRGHTGSDGSSSYERMKRAGFEGTIYGENLSYGPRTAIDIVICLMVDDDVPDRGHREVFLNPEYNRVGIAYAQGGNCLCGSVCVIDLGGTKNASSSQKSSNVPNYNKQTQSDQLQKDKDIKNERNLSDDPDFDINNIDWNDFGIEWDSNNKYDD